MKRLAILGAALFVLAACEEKKPEAPADDPSTKNATTTGATAVAMAAPVAIEEADLSTPADFEEAAETAITKANYKQELATLEADIAKE